MANFSLGRFRELQLMHSVGALTAKQLNESYDKLMQDEEFVDMTEKEWLSCDDSVKMFGWIREWGHQEKYRGNRTDELTSDHELNCIIDAVCKVFTDQYQRCHGMHGVRQASVLRDVVSLDATAKLKEALRIHYLLERRPLQADAIRDIVGNPFQPVYNVCGNDSHRIRSGSCVCVCDVCQHFKSWNDGLLFRLARKMHDDDDFSHVGVLADALEDAGMTAETCNKCGGTGMIKIGELMDSPSDTLVLMDSPSVVLLPAGLKPSGPASVSFTCPKCKDNPPVSKLILDHLRRPCPYCENAKFELGDYGGVLSKDPKNADKLKKYNNSKCVCKGTRLAKHWRGCWVVDLLMGLR